MPEPLSALTPAEAWQGRRFSLVITGRKHRNGNPFSETHPCEILSVDPAIPLSFVDLVAGAIASIRDKTEIPADLVIGFGIYFLDDTP